VLPDNVFWHTHDPTGHVSIAGIDELPASPDLSTRGWTSFIRIIVTIAAEVIFVTIVTLARIKRIVWVILQNIRLECPVLRRHQTQGADWLLRAE